MKEYLYWLGATLSMLLNTALGGRPYESLCGRWWRVANDPTANPHYRTFAGLFVELMDFWDPGHCRNAARCRDIIHHNLNLTRE